MRPLLLKYSDYVNTILFVGTKMPLRGFKNKLGLLRLKRVFLSQQIKLLWHNYYYFGNNNNFKVRILLLWLVKLCPKFDFQHMYVRPHSIIVRPHQIV